MSWWSGISRTDAPPSSHCFGGWALDAFDDQFDTFVTPTLRKQWNMSAGEAGTLATATLLSSALGGWLAGLLADRIGPRDRAEMPAASWRSSRRACRAPPPSPPCSRPVRGYYAITTWLPTFLKTERKLSVLNTGGYRGVLIAGSFAGHLVGAYLADALGRRRNVFVLAIGCMVTVLVYTQGFTSNFGRGIGALSPSVVGCLSASMPPGRAFGIFAALAYALLFVAALLLPETRGKELA